MTVKIEGLSELRASFGTVKEEMRLRTARGMVVSAGGVLKREAKRLAQAAGLRKTGALINNIAIKREKTPEGIAQYHLGVRHGRDLGRKAKKFLVIGKSGRVITKRLNDPFYWRFLELTTQRRQGTSFIGAALTNKYGEAVDAMQVRLLLDIKKANSK